LAIGIRVYVPAPIISGTNGALARPVTHDVTWHRRHTLSAWLDRLAPRHCAMCAAALAPGAPHGFCPPCLLTLPGAASPRCAVCAVPTPDGSTCARCRDDPPPFDATLAAADYAPPLDRIVTSMKFGRQIGLARPLGELLATRWLGGSAGAARPSGLDCLVPVPLAPSRLAQRGFNQALEMARACSAALEARGRARAAPPVLNALRRVRDTGAQAALDLDARSRNLAGCFGCTARLDGLRVGLVDDVMTSGHTLAEAARTLKRAGAAAVVNLVIARTAWAVDAR
jgi:ComF family protein